MKGQKGITLIALVITIIVMLILVAVSVTIALETGLFDTAKSAADETEAERQLETNISAGQVNVDNTMYNSLNEYVSSLATAE